MSRSAADVICSEAALLGIGLVVMPNGRRRKPELWFSEEETARLLTTLPKVNLRAGLVGWMYYGAGRRLNATRLLTADACARRAIRTPDGEEEWWVISYPGETDKVDEMREALLPGRRSRS